MVSRKRRTDFRSATGTVMVEPGLYVQISDSLQLQSPSLAQNISNATTVLPASVPTLGDAANGILNGLSETPVLINNTPTGFRDISEGVGEVPTVVSDPPVGLPSSGPTIPSS